MAFLRVHYAQIPLYFNGTTEIRKQSQIRQLGVGKHVREAATVRERTYRTLAINKIVSEKAEVSEAWALRRRGRIAIHTQHILSFKRRDAFHQEVTICEEVQHEVFVHYV